MAVRFPTPTEGLAFSQRILKEDLATRNAERVTDDFSLASDRPPTLGMRALLAQTRVGDTYVPQTANQQYGFDVTAAVERRGREERMSHDLHATLRAGAEPVQEPDMSAVTPSAPRRRPPRVPQAVSPIPATEDDKPTKESVAESSRRLDRLEQQLRQGRAERSELEVRVQKLRSLVRDGHGRVGADRSGPVEEHRPATAGLTSPPRGRLARNTLGRAKLPGPVATPLCNDFGWSHPQPAPNPEAVHAGSIANAVRQRRVRPKTAGVGPAGEAVATVRAADLCPARGDHYAKFAPRDPQPQPRGFVVPEDGLRPQYNWDAAPLSVSQAASLVRPGPHERRLKAGQTIATGGEPNHNRRSRPLTPGWKPRVVPNENPPFVLQPKMPRWTWGH